MGYVNHLLTSGRMDIWNWSRWDFWRTVRRLISNNSPMPSVNLWFLLHEESLCYNPSKGWLRQQILISNFHDDGVLPTEPLCWFEGFQFYLIQAESARLNSLFYIGSPVDLNLNKSVKTLRQTLNVANNTVIKCLIRALSICTAKTRFLRIFGWTGNPDFSSP